MTNIADARNQHYKICLSHKNQYTHIHVLDKDKTLSINAHSIIKRWMARMNAPYSQQNPLIKAIGVKANGTLPKLVDLTAGFARDAIAMAYLGCRVTLIEQSSPLCLLLNEAIALLGASQDTALNLIKQRVNLREGDFVTHLKQGRSTR